MADTREIVITIRNAQATAQEGEAGSPGKPDASVTQTAQATKAGQSSVSDEANSRQQAMTTVMVQLGERALKQAASAALSAADWAITRSFYLRDDYIGQRNYAEAKQTISAVASDIASIASWASLGPVGIAVGTAMTIGNRIFSYYKSMDAQSLQIKQMDATLDFNRQRAGYSLSSGSVGEGL